MDSGEICIRITGGGDRSLCYGGRRFMAQSAKYRCCCLCNISCENESSTGGGVEKRAACS
ncbi:hypothetical protein BDQ12DRAFT_191404 [Crucibulum laeve]|uniref:Uncharacterized protein n=1 Tax=Crucibulum laeve TaxID=68775 RepID=A0A5C3MGA2_9AGAR|nr:hypothetical protein BDQ12DRAFT_191404 [Crucibulum laeve]